MIPRWVEAYVDVPYVQHDCYSLVRLIYRERWQITLPHWTPGARGVTQEHIVTSGPAWQEVPRDQAREGDLVAITQGRWVRHVGLVVSPGYMLHTDVGLNSVVERYDGLVFAARVAGIYRHPARV
jgi:cell wall-associated NlpC family hydrolase